MVVVVDVVIGAGLFFIGGPVIVELVGYSWHRAAEHMGVLGNKVRHKHWVHHEVHYPKEKLRPNDHYEDAGGWTMYALGVACTLVALLIMPLKYYAPLALGAWIYGYLIGEYFHRAFHVRHHWLQRFAWFRRLVMLHDIHHTGPYNYGIVFFWMDRLFGTLREEFPAGEQERFPGFDHAKARSSLS
ncbi:MAG: sterol desaturase family protein [Nanoarchaeota archaeon]